MGSRALIRGKRHFGRQINDKITTYFNPCTTRKAIGSSIIEKELMIQGHLMRTKFGKFVPLGLRELSHSLEDNLQIGTQQGDRKEKEEAQTKEKVKEKDLQVDPPKGSEYINRNEFDIDLHHWKGNFISAVRHYWHGMKLLWTDTRISSKLLLKLINGKELSRREQRQLTRTTSDILKLVPFAVFVIVPFMEFLIPVLLKLFPNMLPSTFNGEMQSKEKLKRKLKARMEYTKFLQETIKEMEKEIRSTKSSETKKTAEDLDEFMRKLPATAKALVEIYKVRTGDSISDHEMLCFAKLFVDELVLDNLNRPRLLSMCNILGIKLIMSDDEMHALLASMLTRIKNDDILIWQKGVKSLSDYELEQACTCRGNLGFLLKQQMDLKLRDWLDLSLNHAVPISLLILSRPFAASDKVGSVEALRGAISSLPDSVVSTLGTGLPSVSERRRKLEFLEMQEELIKEEERERALAAQTAEEHVRSNMEQKQDDFCNISRALSLLASASFVSKEREELLSLFNKEIKLYNLMLDKKGSAGNVHEAKEAYKEARGALGYKPSSELAEKVDRLLEELEKEIDDVDAIIGTQEQPLDKDHDGKVTTEELAAAAIYLKKNFDKAGVQEIIANLSKDKDGKILVEDIVKLGSKQHDATDIQNG